MDSNLIEALKLALQFLIVPVFAMLWNMNNDIKQLEIKLYRDFVRKARHAQEEETN